MARQSPFALELSSLLLGLTPTSLVAFQTEPSFSRSHLLGIECSTPAGICSLVWLLMGLMSLPSTVSFDDLLTATVRSSTRPFASKFPSPFPRTFSITQLLFFSRRQQISLCDLPLSPVAESIIEPNFRDRVVRGEVHFPRSRRWGMETSGG